MSTKNKPSKFDCYAKLKDDEPYFVLRGKDRFAPLLIDLWRRLKQIHTGQKYTKLDEALVIADDMARYRSELPQAPQSEVEKKDEKIMEITANIKALVTMLSSEIISAGALGLKVEVETIPTGSVGNPDMMTLTCDVLRRL